MMSKADPKIIDFGLSKIMENPDDGFLHTSLGTPAYYSP